MATRGGVPAAAWLATLPYAAIGALGFFAGLRIRNRADTATYRRWVKRALFVIAMILPIQYVYGLVA
jgi:MFS superfamily sulfate permease-like transporter